ncbi:juvenile hormone esterase-like [Megalopta genalis]|uniref:juvenile hormone esterase-like n=1 Tax=Megalopta genalis TaxID=115081 RepID=UPI003FD20208
MADDVFLSEVCWAPERTAEPFLSGTGVDVYRCDATYSQGKLSSIVQTKSGPVRGIEKTTVWHSKPYTSFVGIPFAEPPLGLLRFKPPVPKKPWTNVLDAIKVPNSCPQTDFFFKQYMGHEDCLYLNVYTGQFGNGTQLRPVMVWIYGGAYFSGSNSPSLYGPDFFLEEDVVMVSINYRVGTLGFLALNHPEATGNAGMKDQVLALQWVQDNIAAFGGDPNEVTIFGESAGATSTGFHMLSKKSQGLFKKVIMQSGTPLCQWAYHTPAKALENARSLGSLLGYEGETTEGLLQFLRSVPARRMVDEADKVDFEALPFRPTIENVKITKGDAFLTECPIEIYESGKFTAAPTLMGYNHDEFLFFINYFYGFPIYIESLTYMIELTTTFNEIVDHILGTIGGLMFNLVPNFLLEDIVDLLTNALFIAPIDLTQRLIAKSNDEHPVYFYRLSYQSKYSVHSLVGSTINGTSHLDDIGYIFNVQALNASTNPQDPFNVFRKKMVNAWANFAKYENPTIKNASHAGPVFEATWLDSSKTGVQLDINEVTVLKGRLINPVTVRFQQGYRERLPQNSDCDLRCACPLHFTDVYQEWEIGVKAIAFDTHQTAHQISAKCISILWSS